MFMQYVFIIWESSTAHRDEFSENFVQNSTLFPDLVKLFGRQTTSQNK